jgi:transposase
MAPVQMMEKISSLEEENAELRAQLEWFKRNWIGTGKSEKIDALQTRLGLAEEAAKEPEEKKQTITYERGKATRREPSADRFADLPVKQIIEIIPEAVRANPELYERIGIAEESFEVCITPAQLWKLLTIRPKFRYKPDHKVPPLLAPAPPRVIEGGYASAQLIAYIALNKYLYHLPLYRQEKMSAHWGAQLSRKTMADWIEVVAEWFKPVYGLMRQNLLTGGYVQADETPVRFMDPDQKKGKTTQGYLWVIGKPGSDVVFDWQLSRAHRHATALLEGFEGVLQSDGYQAYDRFATDRVDITRVACWAHVRRKFAEAEREAPQAVHMVLGLIRQLYAFERQWDAAGVSGEKHRAMLRSTHFPQPLHLLERINLKLSQRTRPKSKLGKACTYLMGQWSALINHCLFGDTRLDNNLIENAIRPSAVGKKNFLFIGSPEAGQRTAIIYSIIVSCERHGLDPLAYMTDVLEKLPAMSNQDQLFPLLPSNWKEPR